MYLGLFLFILLLNYFNDYFLFETFRQELHQQKVKKKNSVTYRNLRSGFRLAKTVSSTIVRDWIYDFVLYIDVVMYNDHVQPTKH